jgi:isopenicillin N synthase-like dioxygenase
MSSELADMDILDITRRQILVNQVKDASERLGLFYGTCMAHLLHTATIISFATVKNYCVPEDVIERAFACSKEVFSLPLETKMKVRHNSFATPMH